MTMTMMFIQILGTIVHMSIKEDGGTGAATTRISMVLMIIPQRLECLQLLQSLHGTLYRDVRSSEMKIRVKGCVMSPTDSY